MAIARTFTGEEDTRAMCVASSPPASGVSHLTFGRRLMTVGDGSAVFVRLPEYSRTAPALARQRRVARLGEAPIEKANRGILSLFTRALNTEGLL